MRFLNLILSILFTINISLAWAGPNPPKDSCGSYKFKFVDLKNLNPSNLNTNSSARSINNFGESVGVSGTQYNYDHAFRNFQQSGSEDLAQYIQPSQLYTSNATDINERGHIIGSLRPSNSSYNIQFYFDGSSTQYFAQENAGSIGQSIGINNFDKIVGSMIINSHSTIFIWQNGNFNLLQSYYPNGGTFARDVSDNDIVVGMMTEALSPDVRHAFKLSLNSMTYTLLPDLDNTQGHVSVAYRISSKGKYISGIFSSRISDTGPIQFLQKPVFWMINPRTGNATIAPIIPPYEFNEGFAVDVNDEGVVVGYARPITAGYPYEFIYDSEHNRYYVLRFRIVNFPNNVVGFMTTYKINDSCQIVGDYLDGNNHSHAYRLDPIK